VRILSTDCVDCARVRGPTQSRTADGVTVTIGCPRRTIKKRPAAAADELHCPLCCWLGPLGPIYSGRWKMWGIRPIPGAIDSWAGAGCNARIKKNGSTLPGLLLSHDSLVSDAFANER